MPASSLPFFDALPPGLEVERRYRAGNVLLRCFHDESERAGRFCRVCKGDSATTAGFSLPVRVLAAGAPASADQEALF